MERKSILATLIYAFYNENDQKIADNLENFEEEVLLIHRDTRSANSDEHSGKWNGLGGKCEKDESILEAAQREFLEESGLDLESKRFQFLGFIQFPNFKHLKNEDWNVGVFFVELKKEERTKSLPKIDEGTLHFKKVNEMNSLSFWPGDETFLPYVLNRKPFYGVIRYKEGQYDSADIRSIL